MFHRNDCRMGISIHTLRVEGDQTMFLLFPLHDISIHTLRVEGDDGFRHGKTNFCKFLSTPSVWRVTVFMLILALTARNFYPHPPCGG